MDRRDLSLYCSSIGILGNIYTPSVFCYDEHKKNFDINFVMKTHTWRMSRCNDE